MTQGLREGELDMAIVLTEGIVAEIARGAALKIIQVYVASPLIWGIHVAAHSGITNIDEIRGRTYAISRYGSGSHLMAIVDAVQRGWKVNEPVFKVIQNLAGARSSLMAGESEVFFWEKFMTQPYVDSGEFRRIGEILTPWPCFMVAATDEILSARAVEVKRLLGVVQAHCLALATNPDAANLISHRYGLLPQNVQDWLSHTRWNIDFQLPEQSFISVWATLQQAGIVEGNTASLENLLYSLEEVKN